MAGQAAAQWPQFNVLTYQRFKRARVMKLTGAPLSSPPICCRLGAPSSLYLSSTVFSLSLPSQRRAFISYRAVQA